MNLKGMSPWTAKAILRAQSTPSLEVTCGPETVLIPPRSKGALTGPIVAVALGRIPVIDVVAEVMPTVRSKGFPIGGGRTLCIATYVDNLYTVSRTGNQAVEIMREVGSALERRWAL